jgi:hypothetical protein
MRFPIFSDLTLAQQKEISRIQAISEDFRLASETAFLTALTPYLTNQVILKDADDLIVIASGNTVPTGLEGFKVGAFFIDVDSAKVYVNLGTISVASWDSITDISSAEIAAGAVTADKLAAALDLTSVALSKLKIETGTPVNAVAATQILELTGVIVPGSHAESVLTANTILDGDIVTIGSQPYRFKTEPAQAYDVALGESDAAALDNLKAAINATGTPGTEYFAGTLAHPSVVATDNADTTQKIVARVPGTAANALATTSSGATLAWPDTTLGGDTGASNPGIAPETITIDSVVYSVVNVLSETNGAAAIANQVLFGDDTAACLDNLKLAINHGATMGTNYSTGSVVHPTVEATTNANDAQTVASKVKGVVGNSIAVDDTLSNGSWGAAALAGGINGTVGLAKQVLADSSYLYLAIAANTIADANWRRIAVGSVYFGEE